jgi:hypothetical protein
LNLSSALVKVGRLSSTPSPRLLAASHLVDGCHSAISARAMHLKDLLQRGAAPEQTRAARGSHWWLLCCAALIIYLFALVTVLPQVHEALEFIVR